MKKRLINLKNENKHETKEIIDKVRSYDLKFDVDYTSIMSIIGLSPNGKYGYVIFVKDNKYYIQINNQTYGPYDSALYPQFSNDGSKYGWWFKKDKNYYIQINNQTYGPYDKASLTFTKDNKVYIFYIKDNKMTIERVD